MNGDLEGVGRLECYPVSFRGLRSPGTGFGKPAFSAWQQRAPSWPLTGRGASPLCRIFWDVFCRMAETLTPFTRERLASNSPRILMDRDVRVVFFKTGNSHPAPAEKKTTTPPPDHPVGFFSPTTEKNANRERS